MCMGNRDLVRLSIVVPQVGEAIAEARLVAWQVDEGDSVMNGDVLFVVDTEKAEVEVEAFVDGLVEQILVGADSAVMPGQPVGTILVERSDVPLGAQTPDGPAPVASQHRSTSSPPLGPIRSNRIKGASPMARRRARELGVDLAEVVSAVDGNVSAEDVEAFDRNRRQRDGRQEKVGPIQLGRLQRAVADATTRSKQSVPHFYLDMSVDMTAVLSHRQGSARRASITSYVVAASVLALAERPELNTSFHDNGLMPRQEISVGVAVNTEEGLLVPVLADLGGLDLAEIHHRLEGAIRRARLGRLAAGDHGPRSMVVTNLGMFGVERFYAIINQPDPFILAVGKTEERVVAIDGEIRIQPTAILSLSADHRVVDGAGAAGFLSSVVGHLEELTRSVWS